MKRTFYTMLWTSGLPVALQNLISTSVNLIDTLMVGRLGESALSAVSIANQIFLQHLK
ncbi:MAG: MATE family efflux transporter [Peptococcaceae bacterium]